jgi:hypothetical protein
MDHLPLQVGDAYLIVIHDADGADACGGQVLDQGRAQTPGADHENASGFQFQLPWSAHIPEDEVAGIAVDFIRC